MAFAWRIAEGAIMESATVEPSSTKSSQEVFDINELFLFGQNPDSKEDAAEVGDAARIAIEKDYLQLQAALNSLDAL
jgi:hypothetical protein